ncbi:MAG TPA: zinc ABC transporter substrate-binding protein [bacterium]|nr:zinc ABC transporter substrate-binding protein [bacterium]
MKRAHLTITTGIVAAVVLLVASLGSRPAPGAAASSPSRPIVVAAENFYGDIVGQIAGDHVSITSIISDPNVDPHEYESSARDGAAVARASLVVLNGLGYDDFMFRLMKASPNPARRVIVVGTLVGHKDGDNKHVWYDPATMPKVAQAVTDALDQIDPADSRSFHDRLGLFQGALRPLNDKVAAVRNRYHGTPVALTEPVFGYMAEALGLHVITPETFQRAIEEGQEPPASAIAQMDDQLRTHQAKVLLYNIQTVTRITTKVQQRATQLGIPVVGVSETEPLGKSYQQWMLSQLGSLEAALAGADK